MLHLSSCVVSLPPCPLPWSTTLALGVALPTPSLPPGQRGCSCLPGLFPQLDSAGGTWPQGILERLKGAISLSLCKLKPWKSSWAKIMFHAQLMPASRKEKASFLTCPQTPEQTGARLCCQCQDPGPHPCLCCPVTNARGLHSCIPTHLHVTGTLLWMPLPWGQVCPLRVALCDVLLRQ